MTEPVVDMRGRPYEVGHKVVFARAYGQAQKCAIGRVTKITENGKIGIQITDNGSSPDYREKTNIVLHFPSRALNLGLRDLAWNSDGF